MVRVIQERNWRLLMRPDIVWITVAHMAVFALVPYFGLESAVFGAALSVLLAGHATWNLAVASAEERASAKNLSEGIFDHTRWRLKILATVMILVFAQWTGSTASFETAFPVPDDEILQKGFSFTARARVPVVISLEARKEVFILYHSHGFTITTWDPIQLLQRTLYPGTPIDLYVPPIRPFKKATPTPIELILKVRSLWGGNHPISILNLTEGPPQPDNHLIIQMGPSVEPGRQRLAAAS